MTQRTVAGSSFSVVKGIPTTEDSAGYAALIWVEVGEIAMEEGAYIGALEAMSFYPSPSNLKETLTFAR